MRVLGCVGTAKNTGKTTALAAILAGARARGLRVALTSIGYDGEDVDNVTGLPKPRVEAVEGDVVATARVCLDRSSAGWDILGYCGLTTALGPLVLARVTSPGRVILAGPPHRRGLGRLCRLLDRWDRADFLVVDGAFGRLSPLGLAHGLVLSTGAARSRDADALGQEARAIVDLLSLPRIPSGARLRRHLYSEEDCRRVAERLRAGDTVSVPGMVTLDGLTRLAELLGKAPPEGGWGHLVFQDGVQLLLAGPPGPVRAAVVRLTALGLPLGLRGGPGILAVTVNPFYPVPLGAGRFGASYLEATHLKVRVESHLQGRSPVFDVRRDGAGRLWQAVEEGLFARRNGTGKAQPLPGPLRPGFPPEVRRTDPLGPGAG